jgi:3-deoxy-D-arabino-heptulosonate 7-phosphate (DAHP) synthase class II
MTHVLNTAVDDVLRQRKLLLQGLDCAREHTDDEQETRLEYLLGTLDDLLAIVTSKEARH